MVEALLQFRESLNAVHVFPGIREMLLELKEQGLGLSVISNNSVENIRYFLEKKDLGGVDYIESARGIFGKHKAIKRYLKEFGLKSNEVIYVGDELRDIEACKRVSVRIIAVTWGYDPLELLQRGKPDFIAEKREDIVNIIKDLQHGSGDGIIEETDKVQH
jgi:phosphoglycolate phosphatase